MENATDAMQMAAAVLIFVIALTISINSFGEARQTVQTLLKYNDREYDYTYVEEAGSTERIVGAETILPAIYRAYRENYKIVFENSSVLFPGGLYRKKVSGQTVLVPIYEIDLENESISTESLKFDFIMAILYGNKYDNFTEIQKTMTESFEITLNQEGIYDKINMRQFEEYLGVYYQEDTKGITGTPNINKTTKRVITYKLK